jgi:hypothetical protein
MDSCFDDDAAECNDFEQFMLSQDLMFLYMQEMDDEDDKLTIVASAALLIYADEETQFIKNQHQARCHQYVLRTQH